MHPSLGAWGQHPPVTGVFARLSYCSGRSIAIAAHGNTPAGSCTKSASTTPLLTIYCIITYQSVLLARKSDW